MSNSNKKLVERQVRKELLRLRSAVQREELCQLGCELIEQARPQQLLGRFVGVGTRSMQTFKWGRMLWSWHRRYELLLSSAWLLFRGLRGRSLRWPTLSLVALRLLRFGLERGIEQATSNAREPDISSSSREKAPSRSDSEQGAAVTEDAIEQPARRTAQLATRAAEQAKRRRKRRRRLHRRMQDER